jgi:hypothetical protein
MREAKADKELPTLAICKSRAAQAESSGFGSIPGRQQHPVFKSILR